MRCKQKKKIKIEKQETIVQKNSLKFFDFINDSGGRSLIGSDDAPLNVRTEKVYVCIKKVLVSSRVQN